jgi:hypothetical protein
MLLDCETLRRAFTYGYELWDAFWVIVDMVVVV